MQLHVRAQIPATPEEIVAVLASQTYLDEVSRRAEHISSAEVVGGTVEDDAIVSSVRFVAPTRLPRVLRRYQDRAPAEVSWIETIRWSRATWTGRVSVEPDVPDSWKQRYDSSGLIELHDVDGGVELVQSLEFDLHVPILGAAIEKLLEKEVDRLLTLRLDVLREQFSPTP